MDQPTKYAFILPGGGFKGNFQLGAIEALYEAGITPNFIAGTSVGSLNGMMLAQKKLPALVELWNRVEKNGYSEIWDSWLVKEKNAGLVPKLGGVLEVVLTGKIGKLTGLGTLRPLLEKLETIVVKEDFQIPFRCGVTSLTDGTYHSIDPQTCPNSEEIIRAILASATMPIIWQPVPELTTDSGSYFQLVDGGVQSITPIKEAIDYINAQPDTDAWQLVIIQCSSDQMDVHPDPYGLFGIAGRTLDMMLNRLDLMDFGAFQTINQLVQASGKSRLNGYRYIPNLTITPSENIGSTLDSRPEVLRYRRNLGHQNALSALQTYLQLQP